MQINIPQRLKDLRKEYGFTQQTVADGINIKRTAYQAYEEGRADPPLPTLLNLCAFYGKTVEELLGITDCKQNEVLGAYYKCDVEMRKIVDFILKITV